MAHTRRARRGIALLVAGAVAATAQGILGLAVVQAAPPEVHPTLAPCAESCEDPIPPGRTKVSYASSSVKYGGAASGGAQVVSASLFRYRADGSQVGAPLTAKVQTTPLVTTVLLGGSKTSPPVSDIHDGWLVLEVVVENTAGERTTGRSNRVYVDNVHPSITGTHLTDTGMVEVRFSEPVRDPVPGNLGVDWALWTTDEFGERQQHYWNNPTPEYPFDDVTVGEDRSLRTLHLSSDYEQDEDATPGIEYRPAEQSANTGQEGILNQYRDEAGLHVSGDTWEDPAASDLVPPSEVPAIVSIAGQAPADAIGTDRTPEIVLSGLRPGGPSGPHEGRVYLESGVAAGLQLSGEQADRLLGKSLAAADGTAVISTEEILGEAGLADGDHTLYAAAADQALCNPPTGTQRCPNVGQPAAGGYLLDTIAPLPVAAQVVSTTQIDVTFSEKIAPTNAGSWTVTQGPAATPVPVDSVFGGEKVRTLILSAEATQLPVVVSWTPAPDGYRDVAGNALESFSLEAVNDVPLILTFVSPAEGARTVNTSSITLRGTVEGLTPRDPQTPATVTIDVFPDADADGTPDGPVQTLGGGSGTFEVTFPLSTDGSHVFTAIGRRVQPDREVLSEPITIEIIRDTELPQVNFHSPSLGAVYSGFEDQHHSNDRNTILVRWTSTDNTGEFASTVLSWRKSAADPWDPVNSSLEENDEEEFVVTQRAKLVDSKSAQFRLQVTDAAGNTRQQLSQVFEIDSTPPYFNARTLDTQRVLVRFNENVQGPEPERQEWRLRGDLADIADVVPGKLTFVLRALDGNSFGSNDRPKVTYKPLEIAVGRYIDEAQNRVQLKDAPGVLPPDIQDDLPLPRETVPADDGIAPGPATVHAAPSLVDRGSIPLTGAGDGTTGNQIVAHRVAPSGATYAAPVNANGSFDLLVGLAQDAVNVFRVQVYDPADNTSAVRQVVITEDSSGPLVTVKDRKKRIRAKKKALVAQWTSVEPHPGFSALYLEFRKRNGRTRMLTIADQTVDDGREKVRFPKNLRKKMRKGKIKAIRFHVYSFDVLGHVGSDTGRWVKVRGKRRRR